MPLCLPITWIHQCISPSNALKTAHSSWSNGQILFENHPILLSFRFVSLPQVQVSRTSCLFYNSSTLRLVFCTSLKGRRIAAARCYGCSAREEERRLEILLHLLFRSILSLPLANTRISTHRKFNPHAFREYLIFIGRNSKFFLHLIESRPSYIEFALTRANECLRRCNLLRFTSPRRSRVMALPKRMSAFLPSAPTSGRVTGYWRIGF